MRALEIADAKGNHFLDMDKIERISSEGDNTVVVFDNGVLLLELPFEAVIRVVEEVETGKKDIEKRLKEIEEVSLGDIYEMLDTLWNERKWRVPDDGDSPACPKCGDISSKWVNGRTPPTFICPCGERFTGEDNE